MNIRTVIIDDEPIALAKLRSYVEKTPFLDLVGEFSTAVDAMAFISNGNADAIFTDINMPDLDGLQFIESLANPPLVVFITAYSQYAVDSYRLSAVDYLLKPYGFAEFQRAANKLLKTFTSNLQQRESLSKNTEDTIFLKVDYRYVRLNLSDILYINLNNS